MYIYGLMSLEGTPGIGSDLERETDRENVLTVDYGVASNIDSPLTYTLGT